MLVRQKPALEADVDLVGNRLECVSLRDATRRLADANELSAKVWQPYIVTESGFNASPGGRWKYYANAFQKNASKSPSTCFPDR